MKIKIVFITLALMVLSGCKSVNPGSAESVDAVYEARVALKKLYAEEPTAKTLGRKAKAVLVFTPAALLNQTLPEPPPSLLSIGR